MHVYITYLQDRRGIQLLTKIQGNWRGLRQALPTVIRDFIVKLTYKKLWFDFEHTIFFPT